MNLQPKRRDPMQSWPLNVQPYPTRTKPRQDNITGRTYLERRRPVVVLIRWAGKGPRNVLIQRDDGSRVVRPFRGLRRVPL